MEISRTKIIGQELRPDQEMRSESSSPKVMSRAQEPGLLHCLVPIRAKKQRLGKEREGRAGGKCCLS